MEQTRIWIIDEEWPDYDTEYRILRERWPDCEIRHSGYAFREDLEAFGRRAHGILAQVHADLSREVLARLECCRGIAVSGGGYEHVDVAAAQEMGIGVTNVPGYCAEDLADYVLAAVLHANKRIGCFNDALALGRWGAPALPCPPKRLRDSALLLVGCGRIGREAARKARAVGIKVLGCAPSSPRAELEALGIEPVGWGDGLARADFVSLHIPYTPQNHGLLDRAAFARMKPGAWLINTSRGGVVNEADLIEAVQGGHLGGAVLDVVCGEPPAPDAPILHCPGITVTPHIAYSSQASYEELKRRSAENLRELLEGRTPADLIRI